MKHLSPKTNGWTIGVDLGDRYSYFCMLGPGRKVVRRGRIPTCKPAFHEFFAALDPVRIVFEVGPHSRWVSAELKWLGHEVLVADPRRVALISRNDSKNDRRDAEILARVGQGAPELLFPVHHRSEQAQRDLALVRSRDILVAQRTRLINRVRGLVKAQGFRLPTFSAPCFDRKAAEHIPVELQDCCVPLLQVMEHLTGQIKRLEHQLECIAEVRYPETQVLRQIRGVGPITSLTFVLTLEDPRRFQSSREVGSYTGLRPRQRDSGKDQPQLGITKAGNGYLRRLLVSCAQYILGPKGEDCDLRRWGEAYCARGGKNAKKRAVVAVARKLAVLLHHLWRTGEVYDPLRNSKTRKEAMPAA